MTEVYFFFKDAIDVLTKRFKRDAVKVHPATWQGVDVSAKPEMMTHELLNVSFAVEVGDRTPEILAKATGCNMPWAEAHFQERVCGQPINPGVEWENWPYNKSASTFLDGGKFNHNYMERYWPKFAGSFDGPTKTAREYNAKLLDVGVLADGPNRGIYHRYGDLDDVLDLLERDPLTRQAYMPVFFPEDTGAHHFDRVPCTLGYHFIVRDSRLHMVYYLRSCDFVRHFRDDVYLSVRLQQWVLDRLRERGERWLTVKPGTFTMHITSLHCFVNDWNNL